MQPQSVSDTPLQRRRAELGLRPGQLETSAAELLHRAKELSGRRSYLTNFWYAVGEAPSSPGCDESGLAGLQRVLCQSLTMQLTNCC